MKEIKLKDRTYNDLKHLIYKEAGINLGHSKKELLQSRLNKRMRVLGCRNLEQYYDFLVNDSTGEEMVKMLDVVSTNLTSFFRENNHFTFLGSKIIPEMLIRKTMNRNNKIRAWSAGCSSGEEPYSIAITLCEANENKSFMDIKILATDISTKMLSHAERGVYKKEKLKNVPTKIRNKYFENVDKEHYKVCDALRNMVVVRRLNLMDQTFPFKGKFDFIFCRNVIIYFDKETQKSIVDKFYKYLATDGFLFMGHSEGLAGIETNFKYVQPTVYQK